MRVSIEIKYNCVLHIPAAAGNTMLTSRWFVDSGALPVGPFLVEHNVCSPKAAATESDS